MACPDTNTLLDFTKGLLVDAEAAAVDAHVSQCASCRELVAAIVQGSAPVASRPVLEPGARVGRFELLERVGSGSMGVVFAALDTKLERKVALKLLRSASGESESTERLLREARALAKLSHPHVVTLHEAGETPDGGVYLAMELVEGGTLASRLKASALDWRETTRLFIGAGQGLLAAHEAGLVHRDFKPENVLVGSDGRARVTDFGLARVGSSEGSPLPPQTSASGTLTVDGSLVGTPVYMAPEQLEGKSADAKSDQFAFCVSLYQALFGVLPFEGRTIEERLASIERGPRREGRTAGVPRALRLALEEGLQRDPAMRFPSMGALLRRLHKVLTFRRRVATAAMGVGALALVAALGLKAFRSQGPSCDGGEGRVAQVWSAERQDAIRRAFIATGKPYAGDLLERLMPTVGRYFDGWRSQHREACEATHARGEQSAALLDLRMQCLDRQLREAEALFDLLARADAKTAEKSIESVTGLTSPRACANVAYLQQREQLPESPERSKLITLLDAERAKERASQPLDVKALEAAAERAAGANWNDLLAQSARLLGRQRFMDREFKKTEEHFYKAAAAATAAGESGLAADLWSELVEIEGTNLQNFTQADLLSPLAEAAATRAPDRVLAQGRLSSRLTMLELSRGRYPEAAKHGEEALKLLQSPGIDAPIPLASALRNTGLALNNIDREKEGLERLQQAEAIIEKSLGSQHPMMVMCLIDKGMALYGMHRNEDALATLKRAEQITIQTQGPAHPRRASTLIGQGVTLCAMERCAEAVPLQREALKLRTASLPPEHPMVAEAHGYLGQALLGAGQPRAALEELRQAYDLRAKTLGNEHPEQGVTIGLIADVYESLGDYARAEQEYRRAIAIYSKALGEKSDAAGQMWTRMSEVQRKANHRLQAIASAERGLEIVAGRNANPELIADASLVLAEALRAARSDQARVLKLADEVEKILGRGKVDDRLAELRGRRVAASKR